MSLATPETTVIGPEDAQYLESRGELTPVSPEGRRRLLKRRLNRSSEEEAESEISQGRMTILTTEFHRIPEVLYSSATIEYLGMKRSTAATIWETWNSWPASDGARSIDGGHVTFLSLLTAHILNHGTDTTSSNTAHWESTFEACSITTELQSAILDPRFTRYRMTQSCKSWINDSIELRWRTLEAIQETSRLREMELRRRSTRPGASNDQPERRSFSGMQRQVPGISPETILQVRKSSPGNITLFKGMDQAYTRDVFDENGRVTSFASLESFGPTDFKRRGGWYFERDWRVAATYARYAKRRESATAACVLVLEIPNAAIETLDKRHLLHHTHTDWKPLVWTCRRGLALPRELSKYSQNNAHLIIGTICGADTEAFRAYATPNDIPESKIFRDEDGQPATQYVFLGDDPEEGGLAFLNENCKGGLTMHPYTGEEIAAFEATGGRFGRWE